MTFFPRLFVIACAAYGTANLLASAALALFWRRLSASAGAAAILELRLIPGVMSCAVLMLALAAQARFEPRGGEEQLGVVLVAIAGIAAATLGAMATRLAVGHLAAGRAMRHWLKSAESIAIPGLDAPAYAVTSEFPTVAVVGILRPRMIVARSVLDACSPAEWQAIVAHERWHLRRRDNARRMIVTAAPDVLSWLPFSRRASQQWHLAAEQAADEAAARSTATARVDLASALLRVARLAPAAQTPALVPMSALFRGEDIELRIRRILGGMPSPAPRSAGWVLACAGALVGVSLLTLYPIHELVEIAVSYLP